METPYEKTLKALDRHATVAWDAAHAARGLDDKLRFQKLKRTIDDARRALRLQYYEFHDAEAVAGAADRCAGCGKQD